MPTRSPGQGNTHTYRLSDCLFVVHCCQVTQVGPDSLVSPGYREPKVTLDSPGSDCQDLPELKVKKEKSLMCCYTYVYVLL